jgi:hypothetical protein
LKRFFEMTVEAAKKKVRTHGRPSGQPNVNDRFASTPVIENCGPNLLRKGSESLIRRLAVEWRLMADFVEKLRKWPIIYPSVFVPRFELFLPVALGLTWRT